MRSSIRREKSGDGGQIADSVVARREKVGRGSVVCQWGLVAQECNTVLGCNPNLVSGFARPGV